MKKLLILMFLAIGFFSFFTNTYGDYYSFCDDYGDRKQFTWISTEKLNSLSYDGRCGPGGTMVLGDLGKREHILEDVGYGLVIYDRKIIWNYNPSNIHSTIGSRLDLGGISQNGNHTYFKIFPAEGGTEKEMKEYIDKNKQIIGTYIDGIRVYTNTNLLEQWKNIAYNGFLKNLDLDFYFGVTTLINDDIYKGMEYKDLDGNTIEKFDNSLFPLSSQEEDKLDVYISTVSKVKREILLPKLQTYYKDISKNYKYRIAAYYIYSELTIQKLKENSL